MDLRTWQVVQKKQAGLVRVGSGHACASCYAYFGNSIGKAFATRCPLMRLSSRKHLSAPPSARASRGSVSISTFSASQNLTTR